MATTSIIGTILGKISDNPYKMFSPFLRNANPEFVRKFQHWLLKEGVFSSGRKIKDSKVLKIQLWDRLFPNPIGVAAGYDTKVNVIDDLTDIGFGFGEVGTVTYINDSVNKRVFKLKEDEALIDQTTGFSCAKINDFVANLSARRGKKGIVGSSIGESLTTFLGDKDGENGERMEPIEQYINALKAVAPYSDFVTINISQPNMQGLAEYQLEDSLNRLLAKLREAINKATPINTPPLLLKVHADMNDLGKEITAKCALANNISGLVVAGSTKKRFEGLKSINAKETGGLAGKPIFDTSTHLIKEMYYYTQGQIPIIGVGGVMTGLDAYKKIKAGASLVQVYSSIILKGPTVIKEIKEDLEKRLRADGFKSIVEAIGSDMR